MASDRKRWFRVADSILRDELTRDQRSTFLGLLAWFNQRRARDGCTAAAACRAVIPKGDLITITLGDDLTTARSLLAEVRKRFQLTIRVRGDYTEVYWPKVAEFQDWYTPAKPRPSPSRAPQIAHSDPIRSDPREEAEEEKNPEAPAEPAAAGSRPWGSLENLLGPHGAHPAPEADERSAWLATFWPEIVAATDAELPDAASAKQRGAARARISLARWRVYLRGDREFRGAAEVERRRRRIAEIEARDASQPAVIYDVSQVKIERIAG